MKYLIYYICIIGIILFSDEMRAQKKELTLNQKKHLVAYRTLNGINTDVNYKLALRIYKDLSNQGDAEAQNKLAGMFRKGYGTEQNMDSAYYYYELAIDNGSYKAAYNLGTMYKQGDGLKLDYNKAYEYFNISKTLGCKKADYALGYFHYKGLGVDQDYVKAIDFFQQGANHGDTSAEYFLGLCYVGGKGVVKNIEEGKKHIEKAAYKGNRHATEFITDGRLKKYKESNLKNATQSIIDRVKPLTFEKQIYTQVEDIDGKWDGKLIYYDWSGTQIEYEYKLSLNITESGDSISGIWIVNDSISMSIHGYHSNDKWILDNMSYLEPEYGCNWKVQNIQFEVKNLSDGTFLMGNVEQFSAKSNEPTPPGSIVLQKSSANINSLSSNNLTNSLVAYPNPFDNDLTITCTVNKSQKSHVYIYNMAGIKVYEKEQSLDEGINSITLQLGDFPVGSYNISLKGKHITLNTLVVKK